MAANNGFTTEQQSYLQGFALGADVARKVKGLPVLSNSGGRPGNILQLGPAGANVEAAPSPSADIHAAAQDRFLSAGKKLCKEEQAKRDKNPFDMWQPMTRAAANGEFPKGTDVFLYKFQGLFYVAPNQDAFMCRLRIPGGELKSWQFRGLADLADEHGGGYLDVTTRANLQIREIPATRATALLQGLNELAIVPRGSGGDNVRNVTASATSGFDPQELIETLPLARQMHHHILNHRELYGLPRKFNISFDGGGRIATLEETNDIGFQAVRVPAEKADAELPAGVYFRLTLGGITGHKDFARDTGILLQPHECIDVADAILRVFIANGDRTDRNRARLKYLLDAWGFERFIQETETELGRSLRKVASDRYELPAAPDRWAHVGIHPQRDADRSYIGVVLPVGRLTSAQTRHIADLCERYGSGRLRLTVWQNFIIPDVRNEDLDELTAELETTGLEWQASSIRSGLVACTGNAGCRYAAADTKSHAMQLAAFLDERLELDVPVNIHFTGCHHSCAQHYIGDIGFRGVKVEQGEELVEGYEMVIGGGYADQQGIGRQLFPQLAFEEIPPLVHRLLEFYLGEREEHESFHAFASRQSLETLRGAARLEPAWTA